MANSLKIIYIATTHNRLWQATYIILGVSGVAPFHTFHDAGDEVGRYIYQISTNTSFTNKSTIFRQITWDATVPREGLVRDLLKMG